MSTNFNPAQTGMSRVFLIPWRAAPNHKPLFQSCLKAGSPDLALGDVEDIECPDPTRHNSYVKMGEVQGAVGRATMDLMGRLALDLKSTLLYYAKMRCAVDVHVHFGACKDPSDFNTYDSAFVFEHTYLTNWSAEDLGALQSDEQAAINETTPISARELYQLLPLNLTAKADDILTTEVVDVVICDTVSCGDCADPSNGCEHIYAITLAAGGSPSTPADIVFTVDGGINWYADDIDSLATDEDPDAIFCLGDYIVVVSNASGSLHYALKSEVDDVDYDETWSEVTTGFVGAPNDAWKGPGMTYAFIVGASGYVYKCEDPLSGVTVLDAGVATSNTLQAVHAINDEFAVATGASGTVIFTQNGTSWTDRTATSPTVANVGAVWVKDENTWFIGCNDGTVYYTVNQGLDWTLVGTWGTRVDDIAFSNDSVGYVAYTGSGPRGQVRRTVDGGYSWKVLPEPVGKTIPAQDRINAIAACVENPNFMVAVGLADDGSDGKIIIGED